jgi:hypothetical protein
VLCCFNSEFTKKIIKITYKTDKNAKKNYFIGFVCDFIDFVCEITVKTTEHKCQPKNETSKILFVVEEYLNRPGQNP